MGLLAGRYERADVFPPDSRAARPGARIYAERVTERAVATSREFCELAKAHGYEPAQPALLWVKEQPGVTAPIIGPRTEAHLELALGVLDLKLDEATATALDGLVPRGVL